MSLSKQKQIINLISHELNTPTVLIIGYCEILLNSKFGSLNFDQDAAVKEIMNNTNQLQKILNKIIQTQKEKKLDGLFQILPKELKTPLVPILGYCEMLENKKLGMLNDDQKDAVQEIRQNAIRLNDLINDFWNVKQLELGKTKYFYENIDLDNFIEQTIKDISNLMDVKKIEFSKSIESIMNIRVDKTKLSKIFKNLLENAAVFVPETGGKIQISAKSQNSFVEFSVKDNGNGIPKNKMNYLFKKFSQLNTSHTRTHGGVGLGLTICKGYIEGMKGKIRVESEEGKGTTFFFTVPKVGDG